MFMDEGLHLPEKFFPEKVSTIPCRKQLERHKYGLPHLTTIAEERQWHNQTI